MACQCNKEDDTRKEGNGLSVPYVVHESEMSRAERREKRQWIIIIVLIASFLASNIGWLIYQSQYDTYSYEYSQDGEGLNNINTGEQGDVLYGPEAENQGQ